MSPNDVSAAITNRSLRTIKNELEFLVDSSAITPAQLSAILAQLPNQSQIHAPVPQSQLTAEAPYSPPAAPPPSYAAAPPVIAMASALYAYTPTDAGDLALQPNDRIQVLEHMNNDWWRGRNERTNLEGIFPRTYVTVIEEKSALSPQPTNYGNYPLEVAHSGSSNDPKKPTKFEENGKKFGKKMGNAAIFGAGATVGSKIVNGIF